MDKPPASGKAPPGTPRAAPPDETDTLVDGPFTRPRARTEDVAAQPSDEEAADFLLDKAPHGSEQDADQDGDDQDGDDQDGDKEDATEVRDAVPPAAADSAHQPKTEVILSEGIAAARASKISVQAAAQAAAKAGAAKAAAGGAAAPAKTVVLGDYRLVKKLGQGGMGAVYKAHQLSLDRDAAVKIMTKELAGQPAFVERFKREARVMAKLDHPHILRIYDVGEAHGYHYLAMEYVDGGTIDSWLRKQGKFTIADALHVTIIVAEALQHAHELNLVHRDIKPENILLTKKGVIKVADLGLAKVRDDDMSMTKTGTGAGTPIFMAPEQARDVKHVDGLVDIYALGCMLYVLLTGKPPFQAPTLVELIEAKEKGKFTPVRQHNDEVPDRLGLIVEKMMATKPAHRYQSCAEVIVELEALGLAGSHLSFFPAEGPKPAGPVAPKKIVVSRVTHAPPAASVPSTEAPAKEENFWYANLKAPDGKIVTRKLTKEQLLGMVKNQAVDADTPVSRTRGGSLRALGTYPEFVQLVHA